MSDKWNGESRGNTDVIATRIMNLYRKQGMKYTLTEFIDDSYVNYYMARHIEKDVQSTVIDVELMVDQLEIVLKSAYKYDIKIIDLMEKVYDKTKGDE